MRVARLSVYQRVTCRAFFPVFLARRCTSDRTKFEDPVATALWLLGSPVVARDR
jgi:hypothetical protein